jgi:hypothetical protein
VKRLAPRRADPEYELGWVRGIERLRIVDASMIVEKGADMILMDERFLARLAS